MILQCLVCGTSYEHIRVGRARPVVTCSPECRQKRKTQQTEESHNRAAERGCPPDKHGTPTGYNIYKCRCTRCASWARGYRRELRNRKANNNG